MELYIVRHGIAIDREYPKCPPDPERYLTEEGVEKTKGVALLLPGTEPTLLVRELARERQASSIFVFGHAPHLDDVITTALGAKKHLTSLKKAGVALVELKRISPPAGTLIWLATPRMLRRTGK